MSVIDFLSVASFTVAVFSLGYMMGSTHKNQK